jgi:hypothetical protein
VCICVLLALSERVFFEYKIHFAAGLLNIPEKVDMIVLQEINQSEFDHVSFNDRVSDTTWHKPIAAAANDVDCLVSSSPSSSSSQSSSSSPSPSPVPTPPAIFLQTPEQVQAVNQSPYIRRHYIRRQRNMPASTEDASDPVQVPGENIQVCMLNQMCTVVCVCFCSICS